MKKAASEYWHINAGTDLFCNVCCMPTPFWMASLKKRWRHRVCKKPVEMHGMQFALLILECVEQNR